MIVRLDPSNDPEAPRPFVLVAMALTADGKIATANRAIHTFGTPRDLAQLYALRATADAVLCGARTIDTADVHLGPGPAHYRRRRLEHGLAEFNLRIVVSGSGSVRLDAPFFTRRFSPILILTTQQPGRRRLAELDQAADAVAVCGRTRLDFAAALGWLQTHWHVNRLLCEGGGELNAALFAADLVDEIHLTFCPFVFGGRCAPTLADGLGASRLAQAAPFRLRSFRRVRTECYCIYERVDKGLPPRPAA